MLFLCMEEAIGIPFSAGIVALYATVSRHTGQMRRSLYEAAKLQEK